MEFAELEAFRRLSLGAAHSFNNALTAVLGEVAFLEDAHKHEPELVEACELIRQQIERCARLTRVVLSRRWDEPDRRAAVDPTALLRELVSALSDTLSRRIELRLEVPPDLPFVSGDTGELESLLIVLVHRLVDATAGAAELRVGGEACEGHARLWLDLASPEVSPALREQLLNPAAVPPVAALSLRAALAIVEDHAATVRCASAAPGRVRIELALPLRPADPA